MNHNRLETLAKRAKRPLDNQTLENFQAEYFVEFRHWYYRFFYHLVAEMKPAVAIEIGVHWGHCMLHMAYASPWTCVIGIDKLAAVHTAANFARFAPGNCHLLDMDSTSLEADQAVRSLVEKHGPVGVVFQDSSHHYNDSHLEFNIYSKYTSQGTIWCCDDVMDIFHDPATDPPGKSMQTYFSELPGDKRLYHKLHHGSVIGITIL